LATKKKTPAKKNKGGRPTLYRAEYCQLLVEHMQKGLSFETFGTTVGVSHETTYQWAKKYPEFAEAKKKALAECRLFWERMGVQGAAGKLKNFNVGAWIFNMKNRFLWNKKMA